MPIKQFKPTSPGRRDASGTVHEITKTTPEKSLTESLRKKVRPQQPGPHHRPSPRRRRARGSTASSTSSATRPACRRRVAAIEYDPNRTARIALLQYADGEKRYILAPDGLAVGARSFSGPTAEMRVGNTLPLANMPTGTQVHNIELTPGKGGQMVRSAGVRAQLMAKEGEYALLRLPTGEMRRVRIDAWRPLARWATSSTR